MSPLMLKAGIRTLFITLAWVAGKSTAAGGVVVIGHPNLARLDVPTLEKIYTGKVIEVNGIAVTAVNADSGSPVRSQFLQTYLNQDEDKYTAYWIVRRYIGKGAPPREISGSAAVIDFVKSTPGAIGYIVETDVQPGVNVLLK
jgi:ABC-type phosphate transport system substrate-binding protein